MDTQIATTLIAAAAAVLGGAVTGGLTWVAARRQADAAWAAGQRQADAAWAAGKSQADAAWAAGLRQADAQVAVTQQTLNEQARAVERGVRRTAYVALLGRAEAAHQARNAHQNALGTATATALRQEYLDAVNAVSEALNVVRLEGPDTVVSAAENLNDALTQTALPPHYATARSAFITSARAAVTAP
ncbi:MULTISPECIES: hypothetical protein [unclassified Streptomyces]|uniref:hypothetical protein n=1 Tax=unclassified Streptomyces TaxID=2593676 RepID=UPI002E29336D|nr:MULTISPECIES: hypothetical protein [unclassified Streptomyces]